MNFTLEYQDIFQFNYIYQYSGFPVFELLNEWYVTRGEFKMETLFRLREYFTGGQLDLDRFGKPFVYLDPEGAFRKDLRTSVFLMEILVENGFDDFSVVYPNRMYVSLVALLCLGTDPWSGRGGPWPAGILIDRPWMG